MPNSMTAFARQQTSGKWGNLSCELRSVNHRYLDVTLRLPEALRESEMDLRELIAKQLERGKVEASFRYQASGDITTEFTLNQAAFRKVINTISTINEELTEPADVDAIQIMQWPGVLQQADIDYSDLHKAAQKLLKSTLADLQAVRQREGDALGKLVIQRLHQITKEVKIIRKVVPTIQENQRKKLQDNFSLLKIECDPARLEQEVVYLLQKSDIAEELDRLDTHVVEVERVVNQRGAVGRRLDFLMQELNREANTVSSKAVDTSITQSAIELKVLIEQMREQIQNIE